MRWRRRHRDPEQLIEAVITDMRRRITEARLRMLAADLAREHLSRTDSDPPERTSAQQALDELSARLQELETKRNLLISRARDADARLAIEKALLDTGHEPAQVALDMISERVRDSESEADAVAEVRQVSGTGGGDG